MEQNNSMTSLLATPGERPVYERPAMISYSDEAILELLGPARTLYACDPNNPCPP